MIRCGPDVYSNDSSTVSSPFPEKFLRRFTSLFIAAGLSLTSLQLTENVLKCIHQKDVLREMKGEYYINFSFTLSLNSSNKNLEMGHLPLPLYFSEILAL